MTDNEIRKAILKELYDKFRAESGYGDMDMHEFPQRLEIDENISEFNVYFLEAHKFIEFTGGGGQIGITPKGMNFVEGPNEFNPPAQFIRQSVEIHGGQVGQINQAHTINNPSQVLEKLADLIEHSPDVEPEKRKPWTKALRDICKHPALIEVMKIFLSGWCNTPRA